MNHIKRLLIRWHSLAMLVLSFVMNLSCSEIQIIQLDPSRWEEYKTLRLSALTTDSHAIGIIEEDEKQYADTVWQDKLVAAYNSNNTWLFFAELDGTLVGMIQGTREHGSYMHHLGLISSFYVTPTQRGKKIGSRLLKTLIDAMKKHKITDLYLWVSSSQDQAITLYEKYGFSKVGNLEHAFVINNMYQPNYLMAASLNEHQ